MAGSAEVGRSMTRQDFAGWLITTATYMDGSTWPENPNAWIASRLHGSNPGQPSIPDLLFARRGELLVVKVQTPDTAKKRHDGSPRRGLSVPQSLYFDLFESLGAEAYLWTPQDMRTARERFEQPPVTDRVPGVSQADMAAWQEKVRVAAEYFDGKTRLPAAVKEAFG